MRPSWLTSTSHGAVMFANSINGFGNSSGVKVPRPTYLYVPDKLSNAGSEGELVVTPHPETRATRMQITSGCMIPFFSSMTNVGIEDCAGYDDILGHVVGGTRLLAYPRLAERMSMD